MNRVTELKADLAHMARVVGPLLDEAGKYGKPVDVTSLAEKLRLQPDAVRHGLQILEGAGLVESTHYKITSHGQDARRDPGR